MNLLEHLELMAVTPEFCDSEKHDLINNFSIDGGEYLSVSQEQIKQFISGSKTHYANEHSIAEAL